MDKAKCFLYSLFFYGLSGFGISLTIRAGVGVSSFNSMNVAISSASLIKVGTITMLANLAFLLCYMILTRFKFPLKYTLQAASMLLLGSVINFFTYSFLPDLHAQPYLLRLLALITGTVVAAFSTGMVVSFDILTFPIEGFCVAFSERFKLSFVKVRYFIDIFSVITSLIISLLWKLPVFVREGTLISMLLLSATIHVTKEGYKKFTKSYPE